MWALGSRYVLDEPIGYGASGRVWRGRQLDDGAAVAIKVLREELAADPSVVARFLQERAILLSVTGPHVVALRDVVVEGQTLALVMDLVPDGDLREMLREHGPAPVPQALRVAADIADGLAVVHAAGVVHRDVKPENVLVDNGNGRPEVFLTDFGVSRIVEGSVVTQGTGMVGTPAYLAPEVAMGERPTADADIYSLGIVAYELISGRPPFTGDHPLAVIRAHTDKAPPRPEGVDDDVWALLSALLAKNPAERPASAVDAAARLRAAATGAPMPRAAAPAPAPPAPRTGTGPVVGTRQGTGTGTGHGTPMSGLPAYEQERAETPHPPPARYGTDSWPEPIGDQLTGTYPTEGLRTGEFATSSDTPPDDTPPDGDAAGDDAPVGDSADDNSADDDAAAPEATEELGADELPVGQDGSPAAESLGGGQSTASPAGDRSAPDAPDQAAQDSAEPTSTEQASAEAVAEHGEQPASDQDEPLAEPGSTRPAATEQPVDAGRAGRRMLSGRPLAGQPPETTGNDTTDQETTDHEATDQETTDHETPGQGAPDEWGPDPGQGAEQEAPTWPPVQQEEERPPRLLRPVTAPPATPAASAPPQGWDGFAGGTSAPPTAGQGPPSESADWPDEQPWPGRASTATAAPQRSRVLLAAVIALVVLAVLGLGGAGYAALHHGTSSSTTTTSKAKDAADFVGCPRFNVAQRQAAESASRSAAATASPQASRSPLAGDQRPADGDRLSVTSGPFARKTIGFGGCSYAQVASTQTGRCADALTGVAATAAKVYHCDQVLRVTYIDSDKLVVVQESVVNLESYAAAKQAADDVGTGADGYARTLPGPAGSGAQNFSGTRLSIAFAGSHFLLMQSASFADGRTVVRGDGSFYILENALRALAEQTLFGI